MQVSENAKEQIPPITWDVIDKSGEKTSRIELDPAVFGAPIKLHLMHEVVIAQEAKKRGGNAATKNRSNVRGGGTKPWRQKGTGRARAGSIRSPLWVGGGVIFGPHPRNYSYNVPKKVRRAALCSALSLKVSENRLKIVEDLGLDQIKTKLFGQLLQGLGLENVLIVIPEKDENIELSSRNIPGIKVLRVEGLNVRDLLRFENLVLTPKTVQKIHEALK